MTNKNLKILGVAAIAMVAILFVPNWKSSQGVVKPVKSDPSAGQMPEKAVLSERDFLKSVFADIKAPDFVVNAVNEPDSFVLASKAQKWAQETGSAPLYFYIEHRKLNEKSNLEEITGYCRDAIFSAISMQNQDQGAFIANQAKNWIEKGLQMKENHVPLLNAQIVYQSEFMNQPMQFLATLRKTLALDSMNEETNLIHINLLKTSGQLPKAIEKCKKLVSLQPQNSLWMFQLSDAYAMAGDSTSAKTFLDLAIKQSRNTKK